MAPTTKAKRWYMAGTEGTGAYVVPARSKKGRVGFRILNCGSVRVRVEPANPSSAEKLAAHFPLGVWKQPGEGGQFRFSRVFASSEEAIKEVERAIKALGRIGLERQPGKRMWREPLRKLVSASA